MSAVRTLTVDDDLTLSRIGYERGEVLQPDDGGPLAHRYRVDTSSSLVVDGLVLLESTEAGLRFLDTNGLALTVRDLRRFRILLKVADARPAAARAGAPVATTRAPQPPTGESGPDLAKVPQELRDLRDDALDNDLLDGVDFAVVGVSGSVGAECIAFEPAGEGFRVSYRDAGVATELFASRSMAQARAVFLDEACWLGAERGRGAYVGRSQAVGTEDWTPAQVVAAYERRLLSDD
ncbi:hypothetical protein [Cellulomonas sp. URHE0023]|uniref:hypothetical protein n=1 Tax=Cellulomonas sp. URHE0023 TaxID=1380354 RepID=UPI00055704BD|nr:hypothetical protein [Cellulomonas sp. URHE0023]